MLLHELKREKKILESIGLAIHIRNLCRNKNVIPLGISKEGGRTILKLQTGFRKWEFNFNEYKKGSKALKSRIGLQDSQKRKALHDSIDRGIRYWESRNSKK